MLVTSLGLGNLRPAPGTWGSMPPVAVALLLVLGMGPGWHVDIVMVVLLAVASIICVGLGAWAEDHYGRKDPSEIVADETAGQALVLLALPWRAMTDTEGWLWNLTLAAVAFLAFRICDIIKPPPARGLERLSAGWGVLIDDLVAALYAVAATQVIARVLMPTIFSAIGY